MIRPPPRRGANAARVTAVWTWAALLLLAFGAHGLGRAAAQDEYYPHAAGTSWTYDSGITQQMSGPSQLDGAAVMVLTHYFEGQPVSEDYLSYGPDGVFTLGSASGGRLLRYDPPLLVYPPAPLEVGATWRSTTDLGAFSITLDAEVLGVRGVQTPAGRFNALQVRQRTLTSTGASTLLDLFFVPGVGVVRFVTQDGSVVDLIERLP
jgi:hypothetical protein